MVMHAAQRRVYLDFPDGDGDAMPKLARLRVPDAAQGGDASG